VATTELPWLTAHVHRARILVNVVGFAADDYPTVIRRLTESPIVTAFELNVSCPNTDRGGEEFGADADVLADLVARCRDVTDRPLVVKLAPTLSDVAGTAAVAAASGADGFSLVNTMPGMLFGDAPTGAGRPRLGFGRGGVSGPALLPVGVLSTRIVVERTGLPVIGVGGVRTMGDLEQYLEAGASLVAIGTAALADPRLPERLARQWRNGG
jgi:dihydroorotate dehydrogenase (NAD+) catalytic subunit